MTDATPTPWKRREVIGNATLYLGDCLEILPTLPKVDAVITDPPYSINTKSDGSGKLNPWGDLVNSAYWYSAWMAAARGRLNLSAGCMWTCLNWRSLVTFQKAACDIGWPIESLMIWDKEWIGPGGSRGLRPSYEMVALFAHGDFAIKNRGLPDIQRFKVGSHKPNGHPAEKPIDLMRFCVKHSACRVILDPFMGSGTTALAALESGCHFIGVELDEQWFNRSCERIENAQRNQSLLDDYDTVTQSYQQAALL